MKVKMYKKSGTPRVQSFIDREWQKADTEHFKRRVRWNPAERTLVAYDKNRIVGAMEFYIAAGVAYPSTLVVAQAHRKEGIGRELMNEIERIAKEKGAHKIYLETGKSWSAVRFYKKLGYQVTAELPNHFFHVNFLLLTKLLN
jgi:ribosomal protein S18 acetylase RimI-like enzyme